MALSPGFIQITAPFERGVDDLSNRSNTFINSLSNTYFKSTPNVVLWDAPSIITSLFTSSLVG